eukprot:TRINITY_DN818_c0_g2_i1.p1 TRINITY_DN818_c0_g2~~TRINITY_DN818_c0_g2_i1.p1  ORF type:complete len:248 (-),score=29.43 TRINITY_DN818_c0_g2_i1:255-998(-)
MALVASDTMIECVAPVIIEGTPKASAILPNLSQGDIAQILSILARSIQYWKQVGGAATIVDSDCQELVRLLETSVFEICGPERDGRHILQCYEEAEQFGENFASHYQCDLHKFVSLLYGLRRKFPSLLSSACVSRADTIQRKLQDLGPRSCKQQGHPRCTGTVQREAEAEHPEQSQAELASLVDYMASPAYREEVELWRSDPDNQRMVAELNAKIRAESKPSSLLPVVGALLVGAVTALITLSRNRT